MTPSQTFHGHVQELRKRFLWIILAIGISAGITYVVRVRLIAILQKPLGAPLFYSSPAGSFNFILKLSMIVGMFVALPVIIYHFLRFIEPALPVNITKSFMVKVISASFLLALAGIAFGFFFMIPLSLKFFAGYATPSIKPLISANEYLSYIINNLLLFAVTFQIPLIVLFINWIKPIKPSKLLRYQRHVVVGAFGLAVILPFTYDPISQFIVAIPIVVLFYVSIIALWVANRRHRHDKRKVHTAHKPTVHHDPAPELKPVSSVPLFTPIPLPVASVASPNTRPLRSLDGFVQTAPAVRTLKEPIRRETQVQPRPVVYQNRNPRLSLDGISPLLAS
ncbi:MAG TPA: twin-arginine translocase subunit TatC [Patescibacteria group bacterium]|nr:twin-arginine translocase subunit TatC [Patescibacteria group bacterium]